MADSGGESASSSASGTYMRQVLGGSVNGTLNESGSEDDSYHYSETVKQAANGTITASGSGSGKEASTDDSSYSGQGNYVLTSSSGQFGDVDQGSISEHGHSVSGSTEMLYFKPSTDGAAWLETHGSGSTSSSGSDDYSDTGTGEYSYPVDSGTVSGSVRDGDIDSDADAFKTQSTMSSGVWSSSGKGHETLSSSSHFGYSGSGSYSETTSSSGTVETVSGKIVESGQSASTGKNTTGLTLSSDGSSWIETSGSGNTTETSLDNYAYSGTGTYTSPVSGGTITGSIQESGQEKSTSDYGTKSHLADGAWSTTGSGNETASSNDKWSYSGSGGYHYLVIGSGSDGYTATITGTAKESGSSSDYLQVVEGFSLDPAGDWVQTSGSGTTGDKADDDYQYVGSGPYQHLVDGNLVSGTVHENGDVNSSSHHSTKSTFTAGEWSSTGSGQEIGVVGDHSSFSGKGTYTNTEHGSDSYVETVSGTISEYGTSGDSFRELDDFSLNSVGQWVQTSGSGTATATDDTNESYTGEGDYSHLIEGGTVAGTIQQGGYSSTSFDYGTKSIFKAGAWRTSGTGSETFGSGAHELYQGNGAYSDTTSEDGGYTDSIFGKAVESGHSSTSFLQTDGYALNGSGAWVQQSGVENDTLSTADNFSFAGSGSYSDPPVGTTGTVTEDGHSNTTSDFQVRAKFIGGAWTSSGSGKLTVSNGHGDSYTGSGSYASSVASGTSGGAYTIAIEGKVAEHGNSGRTYDETALFDLDPHGRWVQASGSGHTSNSETDHYGYTGSGTFDYPSVAGTVAAVAHVSGNDDTTYLFQTQGKFSGGAWHASGSGSDSASSGKHSSYTGQRSFAQAAATGGAAESVTGTISVAGRRGQTFHERDQYVFQAASASSSGAGSTSGGSASGSDSTSGGLVLISYSSDGAWQQTSGAGKSVNYFGSGFSYTGNGPYSHPVKGGDVSGTVRQGGFSSNSASFTTYARFRQGAWTTSGSGSQTQSSGKNWSFNGTGPYSASISTPGLLSETVNGGVKEAMASGYTIRQTNFFDFNAPNNVWLLSGAVGTTKNTSSGSLSYSGSGNYSYPIDGGEGTFSGSIMQKGHDGGSLTLQATARLTADGWQMSGAGSETASSADNLSWNGSGPYSYFWQGVTITGTVQSNGSSGRSYNDKLVLALQDGAWVATSGSGSTDDKQSEDYSYGGSGGYSYFVFPGGWQIHGIVSITGHDNRTSDYHTKSKASVGVWSSSGSGSKTYASGMQLSYNGSGSYSYALTGGTAQGVVSETGTTTAVALRTDNFTLVDGAWQESSGSGSTTDTGIAARTFQASGSYHFTEYGVPVSGVADETGYDKGTYDFTTQMHYGSGAWQTSGTGGTHEWGMYLYTYGDSGNVSSQTTGASGSTTINANAADVGSASSNYDFTTTSQYSPAGWLTSGSGTAAANAITTSTYSHSNVTTQSDGNSYARVSVSHSTAAVSSSGWGESFKFTDGYWQLEEKDAGGGATLDLGYATSASGSGSSVAHSGDYTFIGSNQYNDKQAEHVEISYAWWSDTSYGSGGLPTAANSGSSGSETAVGTADNSEVGYTETDFDSSSPGYASDTVWAMSSGVTTHEQYHDHETSAANGSSVTGGGSFQVSGHKLVQGEQHWSATTTTSDAGSESGSGSASTEISDGSTAWENSASYASSVGYFGFYEGGYGAQSFFFAAGEGATVPVDGETGSGGIYLPGPIEKEPAPAPNSSQLGPPAGIAHAGPYVAGAVPQELVNNSTLIPGMQSEGAAADLLAKAGARLVPILANLTIPGWNLITTAGKTAAAVAVAGAQPVGHHYTQQSLARDLADAGVLTPDAFKAAEGAFSGPTEPSHRWSTEHSKYNDKVKELWDKFAGENEISADKPATGKQMEEFIKERILKSNDPDIKGFITKVESERAAYRAKYGLQPDVPLKDQPLERWIQQGEKYINSDAGRASRLAGLLEKATAKGGAVAEILDKASKGVKNAGTQVGAAAIAAGLSFADAAVAEGSNYQKGLDALRAGDLKAGKKYLLGTEYDRSTTTPDGFYDDLLRESSGAALSFLRWWQKAEQDVTQGDGIFGKPPAPPPPAPPAAPPPPPTSLWDLLLWYYGFW